MRHLKYPELRTAYWKPEFERLDDLESCADMINIPHEDYPHRTPATADMIEHFKENKEITESEMLSIHSHIMSEADFRGRYRDLEVRIGRHIPPKHYLVPDLTRGLFPVKKMSDKDLINWYIDFETVHPFQDGNGRVGGVIVACVSYDGGSFLTPKAPAGNIEDFADNLLSKYSDVFNRLSKK